MPTEKVLIIRENLMFKLDLDVPETPVVSVHTTEYRGWTPEEVAERCVKQLISVSDAAHPGIRDQARAFQKHMETVVAFYMRRLFVVIEQPCIMR